MKKTSLFKSQTFMRSVTAAILCAWTTAGTAMAANPVPLGLVPIPTPPNLGDFVKDKAAAIKLGKAFFWDMNVGGDGVQACASCHYRAGTDPIAIRATNNTNPGPNGLFDVVAGPNQTIALADPPFPFHQVNPVDIRLKDQTPANIVRSLDDIWGSQGVSFNLFNNLVFGSPLDAGTPQNDPTFGHSRRVTGRNTPTAINAIFKFANFWDGRANNVFNGVSPIGPLDPTACVWVNLNGPLDAPNLQCQKVAIPNASLASQAVGPPNNAVEMSWDGRTFPQLGRKMLNNGLTPLGSQLVSPNDSVLGPLSNWDGVLPAAPGAKGINVSYDQMIRDAFHEKYWGSFAQDLNGFNQMEANFSLFWGLSVMLYEATLVSDQSPFDLWLGGDAGAMSADAIDGFGVFQSKCASCHAGSELSDATVSFALENGLIQKGETNVGGAINDSGFHNIGVRPTADDIGRGGIGGAPNAIASFAGQAVAEANGNLPFTAPQPLPNGVDPATPVAVNGAFSTQILRNLTLSAPFMHNGSMLTLDHVVEFYTREGNFDNAELAKEMAFGGGLAGKKLQLVAFLEALTDPRVAVDAAPFDHPQLFIPDGTSATQNDNGTDPKIEMPATGNNDFDPIATLLAKAVETATIDTLPVSTLIGEPADPTKETEATMTVGGTGVVAYQFSLDGGAYGASTLVDTPIRLHGLNSGPHKVEVRGIDAAGHMQLLANPTQATWTVDATPPVMTVDQVVSLTKGKNVDITGHVEAGATVSANAGPCTMIGGGAFNCQVAGMNQGPNVITVKAVDAVGNETVNNVTVTVVATNGSFTGAANLIGDFPGRPWLPAQWDRPCSSSGHGLSRFGHPLRPCGRCRCSSGHSRRCQGHRRDSQRHSRIRLY